MGALRRAAAGTLPLALNLRGTVSASVAFVPESRSTCVCHSRLEFRFHGFGLNVSGFGLGFQVLGFGFNLSGFGFKGAPRGQRPARR